MVASIQPPKGEAIAAFKRSAPNSLTELMRARVEQAGRNVLKLCGMVEHIVSLSSVSGVCFVFQVNIQ